MMDATKSDVIAIVLAGGRSLRLAAIAPPGGKAALSLGAETMLARVCRVVAGEVGRVIVVAAEGQVLPPLADSVEVTRDTAADRGPLAAIRDGLAYALATGPTPAIVVLCSCDVPGLAPGVVRLLIEKARASHVSWVVPVVGGHPQVLVSAVKESLWSDIATSLSADIRSPRQLLRTIMEADASRVLLLSETVLEAVDPGLASFADIDTPEDLAKALASGEQLGGGGPASVHRRETA